MRGVLHKIIIEFESEQAIHICCVCQFIELNSITLLHCHVSTHLSLFRACSTTINLYSAHVQCMHHRNQVPSQKAFYAFFRKKIVIDCLHIFGVRWVFVLFFCKHNVIAYFPLVCCNLACNKIVLFAKQKPKETA